MAAIRYTIRHLTTFSYSAPVRESMTEVRMEPRGDGRQRRLRFQLRTRPQTQVGDYSDGLGNRVHYFDVIGPHAELTVTATALVEMMPFPALPDALDRTAWDRIDAMAAKDEYWDMLRPSQYIQPSELLHDLAAALDARRRDDPLTVLRELMTAIHDRFEYAQDATTVDSPIDDTLRSGQGVCQDFAHIMIALARELGVPCRYVSGYLFHRIDGHDRGTPDATHAWVEALLPELGWVGFDPTNDSLAGERHIRVAIGRDYADVPPTRGVFKGQASSELSVSVRVTPTDAPLGDA